LNGGRGLIRNGHLFGLNRRGVYRSCVVGRNDRNGSDFGLDFYIGRRGPLVDNGCVILDRFLLGFDRDLDATLFGWLRSGDKGLLLLHRDGSRDGGDFGFFRSGWVVRGRDIFFRFRGGIIDIVDVPSPVDLGGSLVDGGPPTVDDEFVQDPLLPGNANGSNESGRTLAQTDGTRPLIKGSGDDDLAGVVWPPENRLVQITHCLLFRKLGSVEGRGVLRETEARSVDGKEGEGGREAFG
jgi:hypothetical protein